MADDSDLIRRADSLLRAEAGTASDDRSVHPRPLHRRRSFVASTVAAAARETARGGATTPIVDDDLPVLTEVVSPDQIVAEPVLDVAGLRQTLSSDLAEALGNRLQQTLPALVEAALRRVADELQHALAETIGAALREFPAQAADAPQPGETGAQAVAADPDWPAAEQ